MRPKAQAGEEPKLTPQGTNAIIPSSGLWQGRLGGSDRTLNRGETMTRLTSWTLAGLIAATSLSAMGCSRTYEAEEVNERTRSHMEHDLRLLVDDWNTFWLVDRPSMLTRYPTE